MYVHMATVIHVSVHLFHIPNSWYNINYYDVCLSWSINT